MNNDNNGANDKIIGRIRACLALANSPNEHEAAAAMAKAQELLDKYNLSMAEVAVEEERTPDLIEGEVTYSQPWVSVLYNGVAGENFCQVVRKPWCSKLVILGRHPNVVATYEMANWLQSQLERLAASAQANYNDYRLVNGRLVRGASNRQYRIDFLLGAANRVISRLRELSALRRDGNSSMYALVLGLKAEAVEFTHEMYPHTEFSRMLHSNSGGYSHGTAAAEGVSIIPPSKHISPEARRYLGSGG